MSLMRLLTAGRALNEMKSGGRYTVPKQGFLLPTFGREKKAAAVESKKNEVKSASFRAPTEPVAIEIKSAVTQEVALEKKTPRLGWLQRSNPFSGQPRPSAAANPGAGVVQAELSLDKVQVKCNDLNEADIEIVPRQTANVFTATPARRYVRPETEPDRLGAKAWGWLGSRLFGARQPSK